MGQFIFYLYLFIRDSICLKVILKFIEKSDGKNDQNYRFIMSKMVR
jgi:hypothetical protein